MRNYFSTNSGLSSIGAKTYELLRSLTAPKAPIEKTLTELTALLKSHFEPAPIVIAERGIGFTAEIKQRVRA